MLKYSRGFTLIELMVVVAIVGILAGIAIINLIRLQERSKKAEVQANIKCMFTAEKAFYAENDTYTNLIASIGFEPERGNRYAYYLDPTLACEDRTTSVATMKSNDTCISADKFKYPGLTSNHPTWAVAPLVSHGTAGSFTAAAAGQISATFVSGPVPFDAWSVSSVTRGSGASSDATTSCAAGSNPDGEPCNDVNGE